MPHWKLKAVAQKAVSMLPAAERLNYQMQKHVGRGGVGHPEQGWFPWSREQIGRHLGNYLRFSDRRRPPALALELGTGWFPMVPIGLALCGVERVVTVDLRSSLRSENLARTLGWIGDRARAGELEQWPDLDPARLATLEELTSLERPQVADLHRLGIEQVIGDARSLPLDRGSVDLFTSNNVLEHIAPDVLLDIFREYRRVASGGGVSSHFIDLADHFSTFDPNLSTRNFLRYSRRRWRLWDNRLVPQTRLQISDYRRIHSEAGFRILEEEVRRADPVALSGFSIAPDFARYPREELLVEQAWMVSSPA